MAVEHREGPQPLILVVDDEPNNLELLEAHLTSEGYQVALALDGEEALAKAVSLKPDLILLDVMMPGLSGYEVCAKLKGVEKTAAIPVLIVTALEQFQAKEQALQMGADDFLTKPINRLELCARVKALLKVRHLTQELDRTLAYLQELEAARHAKQKPERPKPVTSSVASAAPSPTVKAPLILIIDDETLIRQFYADLLSENGYHVETAADAQEGLQKAHQATPDVILLDIMMPGMSGLDLLGELKQALPEVPIIIVTAYGSAANAILALQQGAFDFIVKGFKPEVLLHAVRRALEKSRLERENLQLLKELKAKIDELLALKRKET